MNGIGNDYIAMKLHEAKQKEFQRESEKDRLADIALRRVRLPLRLPRIRISRN
jgi:hypothetical protein